MSSELPRHVRKGRGATLSPVNRFADTASEEIDDGWGSLEEPLPAPVTTLGVDTSRTVIAYNDSPDVGFDRSINPYRGCEHGCAYCFARPTHAWLGLSPGLDFETRLLYKPDAPAQLVRELAARAYRCAPIAVGINTDAYQPCERKLGLTRAILEVLVDTQHPFSIVTKSALIERDIDLIARAAVRNQATVCVSLTTLDGALARRLEPRATAPVRRLDTIRALTEAGIPVTVLVAPLIPVLTDAELETLLEQARARCARCRLHPAASAARAEGDVPGLAARACTAQGRTRHEPAARLPRWQGLRRPLRRAHVRHGCLCELLRKRFRLVHARLGFTTVPGLDCTRFSPPVDGQLRLF